MSRWLGFLCGAALAGGLTYLASTQSSHYSTGSLVPALVLAGLAVVGISLIFLGGGFPKASADIGQGLLVGVLVAIAIGWWQSSVERSIQAAGEEQDLRLTLSFQGDLTGIDLEGKEDLPPYLRSKDLHEAILIRTDLEGIDLTRSNLREAQMMHSHLRDAVFREVRMPAADLMDAQGVDADFTEVRAPELGLEGVRLAWADFSSAHLARSYLEEAELSHATFTQARMQEVFAAEVDLEEARLEDAQLQRADLSDANLRGANLTDADLSDVELGYANLEGAHLHGVRLKSATYNSETRWPSGFDPTAAGAKEEMTN